MAKRVILDGLGLRVSKSGRNADSGVFDDLIFDSSRVVTRAFMAGVIGSIDGVTPQTITHNLGYYPVTDISVSSTTIGAGPSGGNYNGTTIYITPTAIILKLSQGVVVNYQIFYDRWK